MSSNNEESVRALDEYYTSVREKMKASNHTLTHEQAEREVQRETLSVIDKLQNENPSTVQEYLTMFPQHSEQMDRLQKNLQVYRDEQRSERTLMNMRERYGSNSSSHFD